MSTPKPDMSASADEHLPAVVTPVAKLKRKRIDEALPGVLEVHEGVRSVAKPEVPPSSPQAHPNARYARKLQYETREIEIEYGSDDEEELTDEQASLYEHMLELIEEGDYVPGEQRGVHLSLRSQLTREAEHDASLGIDPETLAKLRVDLKKNGPDAFLQENLRYGEFDGKYEPRLVGAVFGIDPHLDWDEVPYIRLLWLAVRHAFSKRSKLPQYNNVDDAARLLRKSRNIIVITGAGISTSLGIPDFRSRHTGFYEKLRAAGYSDPEEVFDINEFDADPTKFYGLAGDLLPNFKVYSPTHAFVRLLQDQGRLRTNYTQNIDNLEELVGIEKDRLIQCHGSFATATCRKCEHKVTGSEIFADMRAKRVARCKRCLAHPETRQPSPKRQHSKQRRKLAEWEDSDSDDGCYDIPEAGVMKPDITFFGERLPDTFFDRFTERDQHHADLVIVIGTSLKVAPVSEIPNYLPPHVPHIFISREPINHVNFDIQLLGDCDKVVFELCRRAGWQLKHEMLPKNLRLTVKPENDSNFIWRISPAVAASPLSVPKRLAGGSFLSPSNKRIASPVRANPASYLSPSSSRRQSPAHSPGRSPTRPQHGSARTAK
nr:nad-dependent protein deacetylase hst1 [Quercus suber]